jgi:genome maintenance exonuclease 1
LEGSPVEITDDVAGCWKSLEDVLLNISDVLLLEAEVTHPRLLYKGIVDCVASYKLVLDLCRLVGALV